MTRLARHWLVAVSTVIAVTAVVLLATGAKSSGRASAVNAKGWSSPVTTGSRPARSGLYHAVQRCASLPTWPRRARCYRKQRDLIQAKLTVRVLQVHRLHRALSASHGSRRLQATADMQTAHAVVYATWEGLTGCVGPNHTPPCHVGCPGFGSLDDDALTVDTNSAPCGTRIVVTNTANDATILATVTDREPAGSDLFELSYAAAVALGMPDRYRGEYLTWSAEVRWGRT